MRALAIAAALLWAGAALAEPFTPAETEAILAHGPWPPPMSRDATNRVDGEPAAIAFGAALFEERRLSLDGGRACADCHQPDLAFTDGLKTAMAQARLPRNTPSLWNVRFWRWFGWGGANDTLWGASIRPILAPDEMAASAAHVAIVVASDAGLAGAYRDAFGADPDTDEAMAALVDVGKALAAYQGSLISPRTRFDKFRDALASGDEAAMAAYPDAAKRGLRLFVGRGRCALCHAGPQFSHGEFEDAGVAYFIGPGEVDPGRFAGLRSFRATPFAAAGPYSDDPDAGRFTAGARSQHRDWGAFRAPSLREAGRSAPYMHNGSLATLRDVVLHYSELDESRMHADGMAILRPLDLKPSEVDDLVAFLETLTSLAAQSSSP